MRIARLAIAGGMFAVISANVATTDEAMARDLRQPTSVQQTAFEYENYLYFSPQEGASESPSDQPVPADESSSFGTLDTAACGACDSCGQACGPSRCRSRCDDGWTLPQPRFLSSHGLKIGGWTEVGISAVANQPVDRYNGVLTFNDRDGEGQLNQLWFFLEKEVDTGGYGWDVGGRVDFVYGTDARFTQAADGLEANWNQTERFYQSALPQFYLDVAYNDLTIRMGHFYTIIGYEVVPAPDNFFYSHAYTMQYGEPFTHTGMLAMYQVNDQVSISGGFHRGADSFDDTVGKDSLGFLGGANWTSANERVELAFALMASEETQFDAKTTIYSLVGTLHLTDDLTYVLQHDYGQAVVRAVDMAEWYGLNQYLFYDINECWAAGLRFEWFRDHDGMRVGSLGDGALVTPVPVAGGNPAFPGNFYEITVGLNWKPRENIIVRPECRWDWYDASGASNGLPYDSGDRASQFLLGCDLIVTY